MCVNSCFIDISRNDDLKNRKFCGRIFGTKQLYKILSEGFKQSSTSMSPSNARSYKGGNKKFFDLFYVKVKKNQNSFFSSSFLTYIGSIQAKT